MANWQYFANIMSNSLIDVDTGQYSPLQRHVSTVRLAVCRQYHHNPDVLQTACLFFMIFAINILGKGPH